MGATCGALAAVAALPGAALGSLRLGSPLTSGRDTGYAADLLVQTQLPGATLVSQFDGTIVRWRLRGTVANNVPNRLALRVVDGFGNGTFTPQRTSSVVTLPNGKDDDVIRTFSTRLRITAGEQLGVTTFGSDTLHTSFVPARNATSGAQAEAWYQPVADGQNTRSSGQQLTPELLFNADVVGLPASRAATAGRCTLVVTVNADPDPATGPAAVLYRIDRGARYAVSARHGSAYIHIPHGPHTIEYWGQDRLGQQEANHHTLTVSGGCPVPAISSVQLASSKFRGSRGTTVSLHANEGETVFVAVWSIKKGHKHNGRCVAGRATNPSNRCQLLKLLLVVGHRATAGSAHFHFQPHVNGKPLPPGFYRVELVPAIQHEGGRPVNRNFQIIR